MKIYTQQRETQTKNKAWAFIRFALFAIILLAGPIAAIPTCISEGKSFFGTLAYAAVAFLCCGLVCAVISVGIKWMSFVGGRSLRWANNFWRSFLPLNLFTLFKKMGIRWAMVVVPLFIPLSLIGMLFSSVTFLMLANKGISIVVLIILFAASSALVAYMMANDFLCLKGKKLKIDMK